MTDGRQVVFWMSSGSYEQRQRLGLWALTAASVGESVHVVLAGDALRLWCAGAFDRSEGKEQGERERAAGLGLPAPCAMLLQAKELSAVRVVSCSTEVLLAGLTEDAVRPHVDEVISLPSFWRETASARFVTLTG